MYSVVLQNLKSKKLSVSASSRTRLPQRKADRLERETLLIGVEESNGFSDL